MGSHTVTVGISDRAGNQAALSTISFTIDAAASNLPPDPITVAPLLDQTIVTDLATATSFLYTGSNPIQTGVAPDTIIPVQAAVIRGKVLNNNGEPLSGVTISVLHHPEFGQTLSRIDGMFDLAVNGGGYLTVEYKKQGYFNAQRQVNVPWQDYVWAPEVSLIQPDSQVTEISLINNNQIQVARGARLLIAMAPGRQLCFSRAEFKLLGIVWIMFMCGLLSIPSVQKDLRQCRQNYPQIRDIHIV